MTREIRNTAVAAIMLAGAFMLYAQDTPPVVSTPITEQPKQTVKPEGSVSEIMKSVQTPLKANDPDRKPMQWSKGTQEKFNIKGSADENAATPGVKKKNDMTVKSTEESGPGLGRLIVGLAAMGLLIWGLYMVLKKYGNKMTGQTDDSKLKILKRIIVDQKNSIVLVKCYEDEILLGVNSAGGVTLLNKYKQIDIAEDESTSMAREFKEEDELTEDQEDKYVDLKISSLTAKELNRMKEENK